MKLSKKSIFACALASAGIGLTVSCSAMQKQLEPLYGIVLSKGNIRIQVNSNGCTNAGSFSVSLENNKLSIYRTKADLCRRGRFKVWVDLPEDHDSSGLKLINPIKFFEKSL
jgi:hypothetical protein